MTKENFTSEGNNEKDIENIKISGEKNSQSPIKISIENEQKESESDEGSGSSEDSEKNDNDVDILIKKINEYIEKKNYTKALEKIGQIKNNSKTHYLEGKALFGLAKNLESKKKCEEAINCFNKAIELDGTDADIYSFKIEALLYSLKLKPASIEIKKELIKMYDKIIELYDEDKAKIIDIYYCRGDLFYSFGEYNEQIKCCNQIIDIAKNSETLGEKKYEGYYWKGVALTKLEQYDEAIKHFRKAAKSNIFEKLENEEILKCVDKILEKEPNNSDAFYLKGRMLFSIAKDPKKLEQSKKEILKNIRNSSGRLTRGKVFGLAIMEKCKKYKEAFNFFNQSVQSGSLYLDTLLFRLRSFVSYAFNNDNIQSKKDYENLIKYCDDIIDMSNDESEAYYWKGVALTRMGKYQDAIQSFNQVITIMASNHDELYYQANYQIGEIYFNSLQNKKAMESFKKVLEDDDEEEKRIILEESICDVEKEKNSSSQGEQNSTSDENNNEYSPPVEHRIKRDLVVQKRLAKQKLAGRGDFFIGENTEVYWGDYYFQAAEYGTSISHYENALKTEPKNVRALYQVSLAYIELNENKKALECINAAINAFNNSAGESDDNYKRIIFKLKIKLLLSLKQDEEAMKICEIFIKFFKDEDIEGYELKADILTCNNQPKEALKIYYKIVDKCADAGDQEEIYQKILELHFRLKEHDNVLSIYDKIIDLHKNKECEEDQEDQDSKNISILNAYEKKRKFLFVYLTKEYDKQIKCCEDMIEFSDEDGSSAYYWKGIALLNTSKYIEAMECFETVVALKGPHVQEASYQTGEIYLHQGDNSKAIEVFKKIAEPDSKNNINFNNNLQYWKGRALFHLGENEKNSDEAIGNKYLDAKKYFDEIKEDDTKDENNLNDLRYWKGLVCIKLADFMEGDSEIKKLLKEAKDYFDLILVKDTAYYGYSQYWLGKSCKSKNEAEEFYQNARKWAIKSDDAVLYRLLLIADQSDFKDDYESFEKRLKKMMDYPYKSKDQTLFEYLEGKDRDQVTLERLLHDEEMTSSDDSSDSEEDKFEFLEPQKKTKNTHRLYRGIHFIPDNFDGRDRKLSKDLKNHQCVEYSTATRKLAKELAEKENRPIVDSDYENADQLIRKHIEGLKKLPDANERNEEKRKVRRQIGNKKANFGSLFYHFIQVYLNSYSQLFNHGGMVRTFKFVIENIPINSNPILSTSESATIASSYASGKCINPSFQYIPKLRHSTGELKHRRFGYMHVYAVDEKYFSEQATSMDALVKNGKIGVKYFYKRKNNDNEEEAKKEKRVFEVFFSSSIPEEYILGYQIFSLPSFRKKWSERIEAIYGLNREDYNRFKKGLWEKSSPENINAPLKKEESSKTKSKKSFKNQNLKEAIVTIMEKVAAHQVQLLMKKIKAKDEIDSSDSKKEDIQIEEKKKNNGYPGKDEKEIQIKEKTNEDEFRDIDFSENEDDINKNKRKRDENEINEKKESKKKICLNHGNEMEGQEKKNNQKKNKFFEEEKDENKINKLLKETKPTTGLPKKNRMISGMDNNGNTIILEEFQIEGGKSGECGNIALPVSGNKKPYDDVLQALNNSDHLLYKEILSLIGSDIENLISVPDATGINLDEESKKKLIICVQNYQNISSDENLKKLKEACCSPEICLSYIENDLQKKNWISIGFIRAWAKVKNKNLRIWQIQKGNQANVLSEIKNDQNTSDFHEILFVDGNHYNLLVRTGQEKIKSNDGEFVINQSPIKKGDGENLTNNDTFSKSPEKNISIPNKKDSLDEKQNNKEELLIINKDKKKKEQKTNTKKFSLNNSYEKPKETKTTDENKNLLDQEMMEINVAKIKSLLEIKPNENIKKEMLNNQDEGEEEFSIEEGNEENNSEENNENSETDNEEDQDENVFGI